MVGNDLNSENTYKKIGLTISLVLHALLFAIILLWPSLRYNFPPPGKEGILVIFGDTPESSGEDIDKDSNSEKNQIQDEAIIHKKDRDKRDVEKTKPNKKTKVEKDLEDDNSKVVVDSKAKDNTDLAKELTPEKTIKEAKSEFGKLFNSRGAKSKQNGRQGDPLGARDAKMLEGITRGKGEIGEGLDSRGILFEPDFEDSSQKAGRVVVKVCINERGNVINSKYTQRGSTTTDWELIAIAEKNAKKYRFTPSNKKEQCGTIIIDFIVN